MHGEVHTSVLHVVVLVSGREHVPFTGAAISARTWVIVPPPHGAEHRVHDDQSDTMQPPGHGLVLHCWDCTVKPQVPPTAAGFVTLRVRAIVPVPHGSLFVWYSVFESAEQQKTSRSRAMATSQLQAVGQRCPTAATPSHQPPAGPAALPARSPIRPRSELAVSGASGLKAQLRLLQDDVCAQSCLLLGVQRVANAALLSVTTAHRAVRRGGERRRGQATGSTSRHCAHTLCSSRTARKRQRPVPVLLARDMPGVSTRNWDAGYSLLQRSDNGEAAVHQPSRDKVVVQ